MIGVGIIGLGTVGQGTYKILRGNASLIKLKSGCDIRLIKIAETDPQRGKLVKDAGVAVVRSASELIEDPAIDIVVELIGGTELAFDYIKAALERKKWVVTANKALLAEKGDELSGLAERMGCEIGFEASVCGGIPVIRAIRDGLVGSRITYILGILNGTSNYILTKMTDEGIPFDAALADAKARGFAEKDPTLDVEGVDAAHKLNILVHLAFGFPISMSDIVTGGISKIEPTDIGFAREFGYKIKLLGVAKEEAGLIEARVEPAMIPIGHPMSNVNGVYNAVYVVSDEAGPNLYYGKGAGSDPTGSAVVSDIVDMAVRKKAGCTRIGPAISKENRRIKRGEEVITPFYMRFQANDHPGVLSKISGILAAYNISISAVIQKGRREEHGYVPIVMLTHEAAEADLRKAKEEIDALPFIGGKSVHIRIEEGNL